MMISDETLNLLADRYLTLDIKGTGCTFADYLEDPARSEEVADLLARIRKAKNKRVAARLTSNGNHVRLIHVAA